MAKGLFSWLGFGRKKEEAEAVQPQTPQATPVTVEPEVTATPAPVSDTTVSDSTPAVAAEVGVGDLLVDLVRILLPDPPFVRGLFPADCDNS